MVEKAYTVAEFLRAYRISRAKLYRLWRGGGGPVSYTIGRKRMISVEAAERWQAQMELSGAQKSAPWVREASCSAA